MPASASMVMCRWEQETPRTLPALRAEKGTTASRSSSTVVAGAAEAGWSATP